MRVLILGGTAEARELSWALADRPDVEVTSSLAGEVQAPLLPYGKVRVGGFDGPDGLVHFLRQLAPDLVVDATHPFADTITRDAVGACDAVGIPLVVLRRPAWTEVPGDAWTHVPDLPAAAALVREMPAGTVFLSTGRRDLAAFADDAAHDFLVRSIDPPAGKPLVRMTVLLDRGPYTVGSELLVLRQHNVAVLVTKNSGGSMTSAKLVAARELGLPVVVVDRPGLPSGADVVDSVAGVLDRIGPGRGLDT